jgi:hypothetical protein
MHHLTDADTRTLMNAIALREGTAKQIATWYDTTVDELRAFVKENKPELERIREELTQEDIEEPTNVTPAKLDDLWISKKSDRLQRYQNIADKLYEDAMASGVADSTVLRELRSYMLAAANELGQLLHRGSGESGTDSLSVDIMGIDINTLR